MSRQKTDLAIFIIAADQLLREENDLYYEENWYDFFKQNNTPVLFVINKTDIYDENVEELKIKQIPARPTSIRFRISTAIKPTVTGMVINRAVFSAKCLSAPRTDAMDVLAPMPEIPGSTESAAPRPISRPSNRDRLDASRLLPGRY